MCGGQLLIVTCSHVGHVFRHFAPYSFPGGFFAGFITIHKNLMRVADVWLGTHKEFFYKSNFASAKLGFFGSNVVDLVAMWVFGPSCGSLIEIFATLCLLKYYKVHNKRDELNNKRVSVIMQLVIAK